MKSILSIIFFFCLTCVTSEAQVKTVTYTDYAKYKKAYSLYKDSVDYYKKQTKYIEAVRRIEPGLQNDVFNKIDKSIEFTIFGHNTENSGLTDEEKTKVQTGEIVFVNYSLFETETETGIVNHYMEIPTYPKIKPIFVKPQPIAAIPTIPSEKIQIQLANKDTVDSLMMPDGNRYSVEQITKQYGRKPLSKIFEN